MKLPHRLIQVPCQGGNRLRAHRFAGQNRHHPSHLARADAAQKSLPDQHRHLFGPPLKLLQPRRQKVLVSESARSAAGSSPSGSRNRAHKSHCGIHARRRPVDKGPVPSTGRGPAAIPYSKTAATPLVSGHTYRPRKLSCRSLTKCWKCSVISVTFAIGCKSPFLRIGFRSLGQNQLTPSRFYTKEFIIMSLLMLPDFGVPDTWIKAVPSRIQFRRMTSGNVLGLPGSLPGPMKLRPRASVFAVSDHGDSGDLLCHSARPLG